MSGTQMELLDALPMEVVFWAKRNCGAPLFQVDVGNLVSTPQGSGLNANAGGGGGGGGGAAGEETGGVGGLDMTKQLSIHVSIVLKVRRYIERSFDVQYKYIESKTLLTCCHSSFKVSAMLRGSG